jgi:flagellar capping protein FliD
MFGFNPYVLVASLFAIIGAYFYGHHQGYQECYAESVAKVAKANEQARAKEAELNDKVNQTASALRKANNDAQIKITKLTADVQSGALRLSIPIAADSVCSANAAGTSGGDQPKARAELDGQASSNLIAITADGDKAIRALQACVASYNQVRDSLREKIDD